MKETHREMLFIISLFLFTLGVFGILHSSIFGGMVFGLFHATVVISIFYIGAASIIFLSLLNISKERVIKNLTKVFIVLMVISGMLQGRNLLGLVSFEKADTFLYAFIAIMLFLANSSKRKSKIENIFK